MKYPMLQIIRAFEDRPFPNAPEPDGGFNRMDQLIEVGIPDMNMNVEVKEALTVRPYYLGEEIKFYESLDGQQFPTLKKVLTPVEQTPVETKPVLEEPKVEVTEPEQEEG